MNRLIVVLVVLTAACLTLVISSAIYAQPAPPAKPGGTWRSHVCVDCVYALAVADDAVWTGTFSAGVVRHDRRDGSIRRFTTADGLGTDSAAELSVGPAGDVWAVTRPGVIRFRPSGLSHFDGRAWRAFNPADGLPNGPINDIAAGAGGSAWVATPVGLAHFDGRRWTTHTAAEGLPVSDTLRVAVSGAGTVYARTAGGLAQLDRIGGRWTSVDTAGLPSADIGDIAANAAGELWAVVGSGIGRFKPGGWPTGQAWIFDEIGLDTSDYAPAVTLSVDAAGRVWAIQGTRIQRFDGRAWAQVDTPDTDGAIAGVWPSRVVVGPDGSIWQSFVNAGLAQWDGGRWSRRVTGLGPSNLVAFAITVGPRNQVWTGFFPFLNLDNHVNRFDGTRWTRYSQADGLPKARGPFGVYQNAIDADARGTAWVGIDSVGLAWHDGQRWASKAITDVVGVGARIRSIDADDRGGVWAGTSSGAVHYDGRDWQVLTSADGLPQDNVQAVKVDVRAGSNVVWFGTDAGLTRWDGRNWRTFTTADGLASNLVFDIAQDPRTGDLWLVTGPNGGGGVTRFDGTRGQVFTTADGLAANNAWDIEVDAWGEVWVATAEDSNSPGISRYDGRRWFVYTTADGLLDNIAWDLAVDSQGTVWIGTMAGVSEFHPDRVPAPDPTPTVEPGPCVCGIVRDRVPRAAIDAAVANPASVSGWGLQLDPGKPAGPFNPRRECLSLNRSSVPYHPLYNGLEWRAGCP